MFKSTINIIALMVSDALKSGEFYNKLLDVEAIEQSPTFVLLPLEGGTMLGLKTASTAVPTVSAKPGATEICFEHENVDALYNTWKDQGVTMAQPPTQLNFAYTFVALDPDGHRIRVLRPNPEV
jgi:predicted enzyme related to lactoylglutathione lyase